MASVLPKIIIVQGKANTYKTTAIFNAMNHFGLYVGSGGADVLICAKVHINGATYDIGFASGGDSAAVVHANINFFRLHNLTHMVFACRSYGATITALTGYAQTLGVLPIILPAPDPHLASKIISNIP